MSNAVITDSWLPRRLDTSLVLRAWRGITRSQVIITAWLGLALFVLHVGGGIAIDLASFRPALQTLFILVADQMRVFCLLLAVAVANEVTGHDPQRRGVYTLAVIVGTLPGAILSVTWMTVMSNIFVHPDRLSRIDAFSVTYRYLDHVILFGAAMWVINDRQRARRARAAMDRAQRARLEAEKRSIESDLQAMQARVEPQFLFNTLAQVKELYAIEPARGERMLDELIAYLRAAMPKMRDSASTAGQELELARAYLNIVRLRLGERFGFTITAAQEARDARVPAMLVLPLLDQVIAHAYGSPEAAPHLSIICTVEGDKLRLV